MKLIITEKPSVAQSIAAVLGTRQRQDGYLEGGGYLVSWCLGHLVEMAAADAYDPAYSKWQMDDLPILPEPWQYVVTLDKRRSLPYCKRSCSGTMWRASCVPPTPDARAS